MRSTIAKRLFRSLSVAAASLSILAVSACDLDFTNPGQITDDALELPEASNIILNGLIGDVEAAYDNLILHAGLASDELNFSGTRSWLDFFAKGDIQPADVAPSWEPAATARWTSVSGIERVTGLGAGADQIATANLYAGFMHRIMGDVFCQAVFDGGAAMPNREYYTRAVTYFSAALSGSGAIATAARGGLAQAQLILGNHAEAASNAAQIPDDFVWVAHYTDNDPALIREETHNQTQATVFGTPLVDLGPDGDPRTPWVDEGRLGAGGAVPFYRQDKYVNRTDDIPLVKGWEMRLIEAEVALQNGDWQDALDRINAVRGHFGVSPATATSEAETWAALDHERLVTLWLEGRRLRDNNRFNSPFLQGRDTCFPFSDSEINSNPNLTIGG